MKKLLLIFISVFTFSTMSANARWNVNGDVKVIENANYISDLSENIALYQDEGFKISPNPSKNKLNIKLPASSENMTLEVFDVLGKRIHKSTITKLEASVDVSNWKTGVYLVKISNEKESQTKRFIKQ